MGLFDRNISVYNGVRDVTGIVVPLRRFLQSTRHIAKVQQLRVETDEQTRKTIKLSLPSATISGVFHPTRDRRNFACHSGLVCIDIDGKDNPAISLADMRNVLTKLPYVAYASMSVGGNGMFAIIPIENPDRHQEHIVALIQEFKEEHGIILDSSCKDTSRLRIISYDPDPYINENAEVYSWLEVFQEDEPPQVERYVSRSASEDLKRVMACCDEIERRHIDITGGYIEWSTLGMALTSLGADGRLPFHIISRQSPKYRWSDTEHKYANLMKGSYRVNLNTFFYKCREYGITYK